MVTTPILEKFQKAYDEKKYDVFVFEGGSRSSKTFSIIQFLILWAYQNTGKQNRVLVSRKKGTWITTTVLYDFIKVLKNYGIYEFCHHNKSVGSSVITLMTTEFWFLGLDDEQKIHGLETDIFWINEAVEASFDDYAQLMQRSIGFAILDYNPSYEEHWIFDKILKRDTTFYNHSTMLDNPLIPKNAKKQILSYEPTVFNYTQGTVDKRKWQIYGLGKRASIEGLVFSNGFTEIDSIPDHIRKRFGGVDFGFTNDPTAMGTVAIDGNDLYIDEECYQTEMLTKDIIATARRINEQNFRSLKFISESADPRMVQEIYNAGIDIHAVKKFRGSVLAGIDKMKEMRIFITKRSQNIQKEFKNYTYRQDKSGKFLNEPIDDWNHCFVGETLITTEKGSKSIINISVGDMVLTSEGYKTVLKKFNNGYKKILHIRLNFGKFEVELKGTPTHKIKTSSGWKELQHLTKGDIIYLSSNLMDFDMASINRKNDTEKSAVITHNLQKISGFFTTAKRMLNISISKIITPLIFHWTTSNQEIHREEKQIEKICLTKNLTVADTTYIETKDIIQKEEKECISQYGNTIMERFQRVFIFTTKTGIKQTIAFKIWKWFQQGSITKNTQKRFSQSSEVKSKKNIWQKLGIRLPSGIKVKKVENGIRNWVNCLGVKETLSLKNARYAQKNLAQKHTIKNFAPITANLNGEGHQELMTLQKNAPYVENHSQKINIQKIKLVAVNVVESYEAEVYDLMIDECHEYFANNILVHNCIDFVRYVVLSEILGKNQQPNNLRQIASIL